jgi:hypothetical protein
VRQLGADPPRGQRGRAQRWPGAGGPRSSWRRRGRMRRRRQDLLPCGLGVAVRSSTGGGPVRPDLSPRGVAAGGEGGGVAGRGGPGGIGLARPQVRAGAFCRRPAQFNSAGACVCKATDHAQAGWGPLVREKSGSGAQEMRPGAAVLQEAMRVCRPCFSSTRA